jgi:hypothetical protein
MYEYYGQCCCRAIDVRVVLSISYFFLLLIYFSHRIKPDLHCLFYDLLLLFIFLLTVTRPEIYLIAYFDISIYSMAKLNYISGRMSQ